MQQQEEDSSDDETIIVSDANHAPERAGERACGSAALELAAVAPTEETPQPAAAAEAQPRKGGGRGGKSKPVKAFVELAGAVHTMLVPLSEVCRPR